MSEQNAATLNGDKLIEELGMKPPAPSTAPSMGRLKRVSYTHDALIDLIIAHPELDQNQLAAYFGYTPGWISNILASDAFQLKMANRREEVIDPDLKATLEERFRALVIRSLKVLETKLSQSTVSDNVALRAAELGAKALGLGGHSSVPPQSPPADRLLRLAERLVALRQPQEKEVIDGKVLDTQTQPA